MKTVILILGALIFLIGVAVLIRPKSVFDWLGSYSKSLGTHVMAVATRVVLGVALIMYAAQSRYPHVLEVLGWIAVAAAVILALMGRSNFRKLMDWAMQFAVSYGRIAGALAIVFGGFLVYAVL